MSRDDRTIKTTLFHQRRCINEGKNNVLLLHISQCKSYVRTGTYPVVRKCYLLKNILAYCGYSLTSPFFLLLSEHKHCDNTATNSNSENARSRMWQVCGEAWVRGQRKMSQVLGAFGMLDFTMLRPVLALFILFSKFFSGRVKPRILNPRIRGVRQYMVVFCMLLFMYSHCYVCSVLCILFHCAVPCTVSV
jgi:hypothetical protein